MSVPAVAPPLRGPVVLDQLWSDIAFLHWAVDPGLVAPLLPAGTRPDVHAGATYVGLIPFRMARAGIGRGRHVPWLGSFLETNVRLYSVDQAGRHGVVFASLDADRLPTVLGARWGYRLPYIWSRMSVEHRGDTWTWRTRRRWPDRGRSSHIGVRVGPRVDPTELDVFLTARWGMHSSWAGRTLWTPNQHDSWPLHAAELVALDDALMSVAGLPVDTPPTAPVRFSPGVRTVFGRPVRV